jgi:hypothetical protein
MTNTKLTFVFPQTFRRASDWLSLGLFIDADVVINHNEAEYDGVDVVHKVVKLFICYHSGWKWFLSTTD